MEFVSCLFGFGARTYGSCTNPESHFLPVKRPTTILDLGSAGYETDLKSLFNIVFTQGTSAHPRLLFLPRRGGKLDSCSSRFLLLGAVS